MPEQDDLVERLAHIYVLIQVCPDGPVIGRMEAAACFEALDKEHGTNKTPELMRLLDGIADRMSERA